MRSSVKILIITFLIIILGLPFSGCAKKHYAEHPILLPPLELPSFGGFIPHDFSVQLDVDFSNLPHEVLVYKVEPIKIDEKETERLCKVFSIDVNAVSGENENSVIRKQSGSTLSIYKKTGFYEFSTQNLFDYTFGKEVPKNEECFSLAESFIRKHRLLPDIYQYKTSISNITYHPSLNDEIIIDKIVTFYPTIDGKEIIGPKFGVIIGDKGRVEGVNSTIYNLIPVGEYTLKSIDEVIKQLRNNEVTTWKTKIENPDTEKIIINRIEIGYYGDIGTTLVFGQEFVQPVYELSGKIVYKNGDEGDFEAYLSAIDNQFIIH